MRSIGKKLTATAFGLVGCAGIWIGAGQLSPSPETEIASRPQVDVVAPDQIGFGASWRDLVEGLNAVANLRPITFAADGPSLEVHADEAAVAALLLAFNSNTLEIDLSGKTVMADRVAIGLEQLSINFARSVEPDSFGEYGTRISVSSPVDMANLEPALGEAAKARLAAIVELSGTVDGRLTNSLGATEAERLAGHLGIQTRRVGSEIWIGDVESVEFLAQQAFVDPSAVPVIGNNVRSSNQSSLLQQLIPTDSPDSVWRAGTTGSLLWYLNPAAVPKMTDGTVNVGWNNGEAQKYLPRNVSFEDGVLKITTRSVSTPDVETLPFTSGLVVTEEAYQWGTTSVEVMLPHGSGMWPAIWLLDVAACEAPGRCSGYHTTDYHEIDLLETRTQDPAIAHVSVHWGHDGNISSDTATATIGDSVGPGTVISLERRPGLLLWRLDGDVVHVLGGEVSSFESGPHRSAPMNLIINTAVGGTFAGDQLVGRGGKWWGDARLPEGYENLNWNRAETKVTSVTFLPLGS